MKKDESSHYLDALKNKDLRLGSIGIFLYVGAEVAIGSYLVNYFMDMQLPQIIRENTWNVFYGLDFSSRRINECR